jgi:lysophospholipase L1-like esterase
VEREPEDAAFGTAACRVLAVGDSFTEGLWVHASEAWPAVLERELRERGYDVAVDNGGMRGHTITQERIAVLARWAGVRRDLVIVQNSGNDLAELLQHEGACATANSAALPVFHAVTPGLGLELFRAQARVRARVGSKLAGSDGGPAQGGPSPGECERGAAEYERQLLDLVRAVEAEGHALLLVELGGLWCEGAPTGAEGDGVERRFRARLAEEGVEDLDLLRVLDVAGATLQPRDSHPSPVGHRLVATAIADHLERTGQLAECRAR